MVAPVSNNIMPFMGAVKMLLQYATFVPAKENVRELYRLKNVRIKSFKSFGLLD